MTIDVAVLGEALIDLYETDGAFRPVVGGAPLNVAVALARLGHPVALVASVGDDPLGGRIRALLTAEGVDQAACVTVAAPTPLALASLDAAGVPSFRFYGSPSLLPADAAVPAARVVYCGSIALLSPPTLALARSAWATAPIRVFDPNVRASLTPSLPAFRKIVEEFAATASLVKLSDADADVLFGLSPAAVAAHLRSLGAAAVVVTLGPAGALVVAGDVAGDVAGEVTVQVPAPPVAVVDTTGAGDATMAGLIHGLLALPDWPSRLAFAIACGSITCESPGGATATPTIDQVLARLL